MRMGLLDRFEQSMERLLEGTSGSLFRQKLQPADLGKHLQRAMLAKKLASVGGSIVPNDFVVRLHPRDYAQFESFRSGLSRQLESHLAQIADRQKVAVIDRITVTLQPDDAVRPRHPSIDANITNEARQASPRPRAHRPPAPASRVDATSAFQVPTLTPSGGTAALVADDGTTYALSDGMSTVGRSPDNTIVLKSPDVSRRHARLERSGTHVRIFDMNSTNGTRVNGEAVHISDLEPGDSVRIGSQEFTFTTSDAASRHQGRW